MQFEQSLFEKTLPAPTRPQFFCNSSVQKSNPAFDCIRRLIAKIAKNNAEMQQGYVFHNRALIYELMNVLYNNFRINGSSSRDAQNYRYAARMTEISKIMREHYNENFSLSMLADMLYLSAPYLSRFFDRQFGMSFSAYLAQLRINHALNDTCYKSCYIAKNILENYDRLEGFGYWSLSDFMGEAPLPREMFFGGLGIFTVNGIPKAAYYALWLLSMLGDDFVSGGEGWFVTKKGKEYRIIMYNYRHISHLYAQGERFDMTFSDRYTLFAPEQLMDFHITINNVQSGKYLVRETVLNRNSGSAFDKWVQSGAIEIDSEQELSSLLAQSVPVCSKYVIETADNTLKPDALLDMLEVRLLTVENISERNT